MVGPAWRHLPGFEQRQTCAICNVKDSMEHILTEYNALARQQIWDLVRRIWPHARQLWPNINLGLILGIGCLSLPGNQPENPNENRENTHPILKKKASLRLLQIILSEAAHLIWVLWYKRVIQEKAPGWHGINKRWNKVINKWLTIDRITAHQSKWDKNFTRLAKNMWEKLLKYNRILSDNWF